MDTPPTNQGRGNSRPRTHTGAGRGMEKVAGTGPPARGGQAPVRGMGGRASGFTRSREERLMSQGWYDSLPNEAILPSQYHDKSRAWLPEQRLLLALMADALDLILKTPKRPSISQARLQQE